MGRCRDDQEMLGTRLCTVEPGAIFETKKTKRVHGSYSENDHREHARRDANSNQNIFGISIYASAGAADAFLLRRSLNRQMPMSRSSPT